MAHSHGYWCNARTFPTVCKYCGADVFFFSCDCGSKLFFELLGQPWPLHRCAEYELSKSGYRLGPDTIGIQPSHASSNDMKKYPPGKLGSVLSDDGLRRIQEMLDQSIDSEYVKAVQEAIAVPKLRRQKTAWIERQDPYHGCETRERGVVTELIHNANILKKAGVYDGSMGVSAFGKYARTPMTQLTIHTGALAQEEDDNCSFTFFVQESVIHQQEVFRGCVIAVRLRGIAVLSQFPVWVCEHLIDLYE